MTAVRIQPGQVYRHCDPRESIRVRITAYTVGHSRAHVVDAVTGKRPRQILVKDLHDSPITATGQRRRSGYVLERTANPSTAANDAPTGEYDEQRRRLEADIEDARQSLNKARRRYDRLCEELRELTLARRQQEGGAQ